jgi:LacI family transcriptional regulator
MRALQEEGVAVPADLAVVGFDDITAARFITPALTTVHVPTFGLGWSVAELLIQIVEQRTPEETQVQLDTRLIVRESCGAQTSGAS